MLTMTYGELLTAKPAIEELAQSKTLAPALMLRVYRIARAINGPLEDFDAARSQLIDGYTEKDEHGNPTPVVESGKTMADRVNITDPAAARRALNELLAETVEFSTQPLPVSLFNGNGKAEVSAATLLQLGPLLTDDEQDEDTSSA